MELQNGCRKLLAGRTSGWQRVYVDNQRDLNDLPPVFENMSYVAYIEEETVHVLSPILKVKLRRHHGHVVSPILKVKL